jgi:hypothetical protein
MVVSNVLVIATSVSPTTLFAVTLLSCGLFGVNSAVSGGGIFGLSGCLPPEYTAAVMCGQGLGGVVVAVVSIASIYLSPVKGFCPVSLPGLSEEEQEQEQGAQCGAGAGVEVDYSAVFFFGTCCVVLLLCFASFFALLVLPFTRYTA